MSKENKKPMSKAKKNLIAAIIWLVAGAIFITTGGIMITMEKQIDKIFAVVILCCGSAIIGLGIYMLIKNIKAVKQEKAL